MLTNLRWRIEFLPFPAAFSVLGHVPTDIDTAPALRAVLVVVVAELVGLVVWFV